MAFVTGKCCANCQYWNAERKVGPLKTKAEVKSLSDKGMCMNRKCAQRGGKMVKPNEFIGCMQFEKWDQLKDDITYR